MGVVKLSLCFCEMGLGRGEQHCILSVHMYCLNSIVYLTVARQIDTQKERNSAADRVSPATKKANMNLLIYLEQPFYVLNPSDPFQHPEQSNLVPQVKVDLFSTYV